jgi:hydrogenase/urease accessory protein HupE
MLGFLWNYMARRLLLTLILMSVAGVVAAHPAPFSYLDFHLDERGVRGALVVHDFDAAHELGLDKPEALLEPAVALERREQLIRVIESRLHIAADDQRIVPSWGAMQVLTSRQSLRLSFELPGRAPGRLDLDTVLFPYDANHQSFINVYEQGALKHQAILDARRHTLSYYSGSLQGRWAVVRTFVAAGVHHIFIGVDHILFLLGLLLLGGSLWRLTAIVTAFTAGHSVTLSLAALGVVQISPALVEPAIALSIVVVGVDNLLVGARQSQAKDAAAARDLRPWLAGAFGLIHGFGFAGVLLEFGLPRAALGWSLAAFNVGVEIGQLVIVLILAASLALLRRRSPTFAHRFALFGSIIVVCAGLYWFVQRVWFTSAA